jgi:hypothetical protein
MAHTYGNATAKRTSRQETTQDWLIANSETPVFNKIPSGLIPVGFQPGLRHHM